MNRIEYLQELKKSLSRFRKLTNKENKYFKRLMSDVLTSQDLGHKIRFISPDTSIPEEDNQSIVYLNLENEVIDTTELEGLVDPQYYGLLTKFLRNKDKLQMEKVKLQELCDLYSSSSSL